MIMKQFELYHYNNFLEQDKLKEQLKGAVRVETYSWEGSGGAGCVNLKIFAFYPDDKKEERKENKFRPRFGGFEFDRKDNVLKWMGE